MPKDEQRDEQREAHGIAAGHEIAVIGIGANIGNPREQVDAAFSALANLPDTRVLQRSSLYRSAPVGKTDQPDFVNAAALITTSLKPRELLVKLLDIEHNNGRKRSIKNGPRTLDLDLLTYGGRIMAEPGLSVPHPRMHERRFVLDPLVEIAPDCMIPGRGPARDWLAKTLDQNVERLEP